MALALVGRLCGRLGSVLANTHTAQRDLPFSPFVRRIATPVSVSVL